MNSPTEYRLFRIAPAVAATILLAGFTASCGRPTPRSNPTAEPYPGLALRPNTTPWASAAAILVARRPPRAPVTMTATSRPFGIGGGAPSIAAAPYANGGAASLSLPNFMPATGSAAQSQVSSESGIGEAYARIWDNPFRQPLSDPWSTFALDVDTASYSNIRRFLNEGQMPPLDAVRIEEMVNYFSYSDAAPVDGTPFAVTVEAGAAPWAPQHRLVRIGLKGRQIERVARPPVSLVFLLDVSGSMADPNKLPLVKQSMRMLTAELKPDDTVAMVVYAGASGLVLPATSGSDTETILAAIDQLEAGGSTAGSEGIELAYEVAAQSFITSGINRVILATDGDFNVGITDPDALVDFITEKAKLGVFLTVLGYGMYNLKDATLEGLADHGNGSYAYIDSLREAQKVLVDEVGQTLVTIAKDVKLQVEFNPETVTAYRLLGYENRLLAAEDFNDDTKDGGEMGAGHSVTALYEVVPAGIEAPTPIARPTATPVADPTVDTTATAAPAEGDAVDIDPLRYQGSDRAADAAGELLTVKLRYKAPDGTVSERLTVPLRDNVAAEVPMSSDWRFAAATAAFGMLLRHSPHLGGATYEMVLALGESSQDGASDPQGRRVEFLRLVRTAASIVGGRPPVTQPYP